MPKIYVKYRKTHYESNRRGEKCQQFFGGAAEGGRVLRQAIVRFL
jgi:hypothetical protein